MLNYLPKFSSAFYSHGLFQLTFEALILYIHIFMVFSPNTVTDLCITSLVSNTWLLIIISVFLFTVFFAVRFLISCILFHHHLF